MAWNCIAQRMAVGMALAAAVTLAGCVEEQGPGSPALAGGDSGDCPKMKKEMDRLVAQGKTGGKEYTAVLDRYFAQDCQNQ